MPTVIAERDLRNQNASIIAAVAAGESFIVTRNGTPVAELRPVVPGRRVFVSKAALAAVAANGVHLDAASWRTDLDRVVDQDL